MEPEHDTLPEGWKSLTFGDLAAEYLSGGTPSSNRPAYWDGEIAWTTSAPIGAQDISIGLGQRTITTAGLKNSATSLVPRGSLLVGTRVGVGKAVVTEIDIAISQDLTGVALLSEADARFLAYQFKTETVQAHFNGRKRGTTIQGVSRLDLATVPINLPPLPEQRAIARVLHAVQDARDTRQRERDAEHERRAWLLDHLLTHGTRGVALKDTDLGPIPETWTVAAVGQLAEIKGGKRLPKGAPFAATQTPHPYIRVSDFSEGGILEDQVRCITPNVQATIKRYIIRSTDVYISIAGSIGLVGVIPPALDGANLTENAARIVPDASRLLNAYLFRYLAAPSGQHQIDALTAKTTQPKLALARIAQIQVPLPPLDEQREIADVLGACDAKIAALDAEAARLDELFRALLDDLMTGRRSARALIYDPESAAAG